MDIRTLLYLILGMPLLVHAVTLSSGNSSRPRLSRSRSLRSSTSSRRNIPSADPPSFFVPSTTKLPLTALAIRSDRNSHLHPQILLQQHLNRGIKRHSRMTRRSSSSDNAQLTERLSRKIQKRWDGLQASSTSISSSSPPVTKRWRAGEALAGASAAVQHMKDRVASILSGSTRTAATNVGLAASASARVDVSGVAGASVAAQRAARITATAHSTVDGDGEGFDSLEYAAAMNNTNLDAEPVHCRQLSRFDHRGERRYFSEIQVGSSNQTFRVLMDSGSADFWIPSSLCTECDNHAWIGSDSSTTFSDSGVPWSVTYGTGNVAGTTVTDDVLIAGLSIPQLQFGVVTVESDDFSDPSVPFDGLMGLARTSLSSQGIPTPIERMANDGLVISAQMGYKLGRVRNGKNDGEVTFGGVDGSKYNRTLHQLPNVNKQGFWEAQLADVLVNNVTVSASLRKAGRTAILDTGTTLIIAPAADAEALHRAIPGAKPDGQGGFTLPCTTTAVLSLSFATSTGNAAFPLLPSDFTFLPLTDDLEGDCISSISSGDVGTRGEWLVGAAFLKNVYFATDVQSNAIGLAVLS